MRQGFDNLTLAEKLNKDIMIAIHKHKKETIKLQLVMMSKFRQFLTQASFETIKKQAMSVHLKKPQVVPIMRILADKYSSIGDHKQAMHYIERSDDLAKKMLCEGHKECLLNKIAKVEILLRQSDEERLEEAGKIAQSALAQAQLLFGSLNLTTNSAKMTCALALGRLEA